MKRPADKGARNLLTKNKHSKRLKALNLTGDFYCYKAQGKPCSCAGCSPNKYKRSTKHKKKITEE